MTALREKRKNETEGAAKAFEQGTWRRIYKKKKIEGNDFNSIIKRYGPKGVYVLERVSHYKNVSTPKAVIKLGAKFTSISLPYNAFLPLYFPKADGAGGFYTSVENLHDWVSTQSENNLSWQMTKDIKGRKVLWHNGDYFGTHSFVLRVNELNLTLNLLSSQDLDKDLKKLLNFNLLNMLLGKEYKSL